jgi:hypothetical protein
VPERGHVEAGVREDLDARLPFEVGIDRVYFELLGELDRPVGREPDMGVRVQRGDLIRVNAFLAIKKTSVALMVIGGHQSA